MHVYTIQKQDIGQGMISAHRTKHGKNIFLYDFFGRVQKQDIGKQVFFRNGYHQIENNEQFNKKVQHAKTV